MRWPTIFLALLVIAFTLTCSDASTSSGEGLPRSVELEDGSEVRLGARLPIEARSVSVSDLAPGGWLGEPGWRELPDAVPVRPFAGAERLYAQLDTDGNVKRIRILLPPGSFSLDSWVELWGETPVWVADGPTGVNPRAPGSTRTRG